MKQVQKWQFSDLMDQSIIFVQIFPRFPLYAKWAKITLYLKGAPFKYSKWKFVSEISQFVSLPKLTQNLLQFQNKQI